MSEEPEPIDWDAQDEKDERRRRSMLRRFRKENRELLLNKDGLRRLRDISDEEWQEAVDAEAIEGP